MFEINRSGKMSELGSVPSMRRRSGCTGDPQESCLKESGLSLCSSGDLGMILSQDLVVVHIFIKMPGSRESAKQTNTDLHV